MLFKYLRGLLSNLISLLLVSLLFLATTHVIASTAAVNGAGYKAKIQRTSHNVAHITASDLPNAWFGQNYAMAEDREVSEHYKWLFGEKSQHLVYCTTRIGGANMQ